MSTESSLEMEIDQLRERFIKYTKLAFQLIPRIENPHILDIGCGSGIPAIVLAKLSEGKITGIDTDQRLLNRFKKRIEEEGLSNQVVTKKCSLFDIDFPDEAFDIVWAEGSIWIIGFKKGLEKWRHLLKPKGFLVIHDSVKTVLNKLDMLSSLGYELVKHFKLPEDAWLKDYAIPLEKLIKKQRKKTKDTKTLKMLERYQNEVNTIKNNPKDHFSAFYILKKSQE
jgi:ubiquinone/menaquinone biosynthesis C-methylase UbiE